MVVSGQVCAHGRFTTRDRGPGTHNIGGWMGCRAILAVLKKNKEIFLCRKSNLDYAVGSPTLIVMLCVKRQSLSV
jgi:hypothetical protein